MVLEIESSQSPREDGIGRSSCRGKEDFYVLSNAAGCMLRKDVDCGKGAKGGILINASVEEDVRHLIVLHVFNLGRPLSGGTRRC